MANLYIRNLPDDLYVRLRESAARNRRSMSAEVVAFVEEALGRKGVPEQRMEALERITERRRSYKSPTGATDGLTLLREDRDR